MVLARIDDDTDIRPHQSGCEDCDYARWRDISSLCSFPEDKRRAILDAASRPKPPPQYLKTETCEIPSRAYFEWRRNHRPKKKPGRLAGCLRDPVIERDGYVCGLCGKPVKPDDVHIDHVLPYSKGGKTVVENLRVTHSRCNMRRGNRLDWSPQ